MFYIRKGSQRGVIIIMALVVLVIASVLAVTFATSMRLEEKTAVAFKKQGKVSGIAQSGYEYAMTILRKDKAEEATRPYDALNEDWRAIFSPAGDEENPEQNLVALDGIDSNGVLVDGVRYDARWINLHSDPAVPNSKLLGRFAVLIVDEASKINLHASGDGTRQNQGWTPFEIDLTNLKNPNTGASLFNATTAPRLINYRHGDETGEDVNTRYPGNKESDDDKDNAHLVKDGIDNDGDGDIDEVNEGRDEPDEYVSRIPYGSGDEADFALKTVDELFKIKGIGKTTMRMCKNFTTVDAQDREKYWDGSAWQDKINIHAVRSVDALFNLIAAETSNANAARWTINIIDYGDRDNVPTVKETGGVKYLGIEGLQINEVMARVHPDELAWHKPALYLDNFVGGDTWNDPDTFTDNGNWKNDIWVAEGVNDGLTDTWTWDWDNGTYDIYIYRDSSCVGEDFDYDFQDGQTGTTNFGSNAYYPVPNVTISTNEIKLTLTAVTTGQKSRFDHIGIVAGQYVELVNLSSQPITIDKTWGINVGGDIVLENNTAKIVSGTGTTYKFTWLEGDADTFTIPGSPGWPDYNYFIAADSRYALDYKHAYGADFKDGIWGSVGNEGNEPGYLGVIGNLDINDGGCKNISLIREVNGENIVVDFIPSESNASGFGTSYWHEDTSPPEEDKSFERQEAIQDTSLWALTTENWGQGTPGAKNSVTDAPPVGPTKDRPFPSPGFIMDVYTGMDSSTKITHTDVRDFIQSLTTTYQRLEVENSDSPPSWPTDTGMDGTTRYLSDGTTSATLTWGTGDSPKLHIPDGSYNLFIAGGIGGKFECPDDTARAMRPDGLAYCGTAIIGGGTLIVNVFGDGSNLYSLDYILLIPNKDSPSVIGKININTASEQVLNALPPADFATGGHIIGHRNGVDNKDGTADDNPFKNIGEYLDITGYGAGGNALLVEAYQKQANLITVRSDIFEIIVLGQAIEELTNIGQYDPPPAYDPENPLSGAELMSDEIIGEEKIRAIVDRSFDPPKVLYFRRELK